MVAVSVGAHSGPAGPARTVPGLRYARSAYLVIFVLLTVVFAEVPAVRAPIGLTLGLIGTIAVFGGARMLQPQRLGGWRLMGTALLMLSVAEFLDLLGHRADHLELAIAHIGYLLVCVPLAIGLFALGRPTSVHREWPTTLDTIALSLAGALVVWVFLVRPAVTTMHMQQMGRIAAIATWVGFTAVFATCVRLLLLWRANPSAIVLSVAVAAYLVGNYTYALRVMHGHHEIDVVVHAEYLTFIGLAGAAALLPSMATIATRALETGQFALGPTRLFVLGLTMLVAPTILLVEATSGPVDTGVAIAVVSAVVGLLMIIRLTIGARAYQRRGASAVAVRAALRAMVMATTATEVTACLTTALRSMLPRSAGAHASIVAHGKHDGASSTIEGTSTVLSRREDGPGELLVRVGSEALPVTGLYAIMFTGPVRQLAESALGLEGLAEQAAAALARIDVVGALQAEERDRYFRTLVLTSTDATLILRHGRVDYATPSADAMFGRDVHGTVFEDLISADQVDGTPSIVDGAGGREAAIRRPDGTARIVRILPRDLTHDPTVNGEVVTVRDVTAERELQRSLAYRASHDPLTGLVNPERLRDQLRADRDRVSADGMTAMLFLDLDDFKQVNDTFGHDVGDGLLVNVAHRIRACLRNEDVAARLGGDEFAALLRDVADEDAARRTAQRIADELSRPVHVAGVTVETGASVGLAIARTPVEYDSLLRRADTALYIAKANGKGHWREYQDGMISPIRRRSDLRVELENAMRDDTLALHYQPIVDLASGRPVGFEALIRFERDGGGSIPPQELIRIAEENGLIVPLGEWVIRRALRDLSQLSRAGGRRPYVSVNVSPNQLRQKGFAEAVLDRLRDTGMDPSQLVLEITERLLVAEDAQAWGYLEELRGHGVRVAIDDYGTGCASLSYLRQPSIDVVKIDRSFLLDVGTDRGRALLEALVRLTVQLGLMQIAEGVESAATRDALLVLGCRYGQGFYYSPPVPLPTAVGWAGAELPVPRS
jgi:diguanylate cyclase (GGDEF)-like protein